MILADKYSWNSSWKKNWLKYLLSLVLLATIAYFVYPLVLQVLTHNDSRLFYCDAENVWRKSFVSNGQYFSRGTSQSNLQARSGQYSSLVKPGNGIQYGVSGSFKSFHPQEKYRASVWYKDKGIGGIGGLAVSSEQAGVLYFSSEEVVEEKDQWKKIQVDFTIPIGFEDPFLKVFVYSNGLDSLFFDDLEVTAIAQEKTPELSPDVLAFDPPNLHLTLSEKAFAKIKEKRDYAKKIGILIKDEDSWVKANLKQEDVSVPVKIRLKGDWTDHLEGDKWSFRVKVKDPYAWNRLIVFSLQSPRARYFADEWFIHKFWEREDVLTTRYDFGKLSLNEKYLGVYAYEEHFDKQLLEFKNRREGPILRFVEDAMWEVRQQKITGKVTGQYHPAIAQMEVSDIQPFKEGRTAANPKLKNDFEIARTLLHQFQKGEKKAAEIFDLERMGKFFAICDIMGAHHALIWHNQRFYYNPVIGKLEPVGYDALGGKAYDFPSLLGQGAIKYDRPQYVSSLKRLVEDSDFLRHYFKYLFLFSSEEYLRSFYNQVKEGLEMRSDLIREEFVNYRFDHAAMFNRAKRARLQMNPLQGHSVRAYWNEEEQKSPTLILRNFHEMPLVFVGTGPQKDRMTNPLAEPQYLSAFYYGYAAKSHEFSVPVDAKFAFYKPYGIDTLFSTAISSWGAQLKQVPPQRLKPKSPLASNEWYEVEGSTIRFRPGLQVINKDIIIPEDKQVFINAGTQLDFQKGTKFISYSPVNISGTQDDPVRIVSSDQSARGFTILQADALSELTYVVFDHFNTLSDNGWQLTGAVTFYESDVNIKNCIFENNHCEDGLNLIRSVFQMENVTVRNTPSDGFDADFCEGVIINSHFNDTGNDGIDFSGSKIDIVSCFMKNNGDKAISVGEDSDVNIQKAKVDGAVIGAASKDLSFLQIKHIELRNCNQGFAAYQKKPEYGPSVIQVDKYVEENLRYLHTIAPGCTLRTHKQLIVGER